MNEDAYQIRFSTMKLPPAVPHIASRTRGTTNISLKPHLVYAYDRCRRRVMPNVQPIARRAHKKSRTGCRSCKKRKVKCDERRPLCLNCERHFVNIESCDFDDQGIVLSTEPHVSTTRSAETSSKALPDARLSQPIPWQQPDSLSHAPSQGLLDPFLTYPDTGAPDVDTLMNHYLSQIVYRSFPFWATRQVIELWWPFVRADEVLFNAILLQSSYDLEHLRGPRELIYSNVIHDQTLVLLRQRVVDATIGVSDHTIVAVAVLAALEHDQMHYSAMNAHMKGLRQMVDLRGGLKGIRCANVLAANFIFWLALVVMDESEYVPFDFGDSYDLPEWDRLTGRIEIEGQVDVDSLRIDDTTANIFREVQNLSKRYTSAAVYDTPQQAVCVLSQLCSIIERLLHLGRTPVDHDTIPGLAQSCRFAAAIHVFTPLSGYFPSPFLILAGLVRDLKSSLTRVMQAIDNRKSDLVFWLLSVGGISSHSMPERAWYVGHLRDVTPALGIDTWDDMKAKLLSFTFHDNMCDLSYLQLWKEVNDVLPLSSGYYPGEHEFPGRPHPCRQHFKGEVMRYAQEAVS